jgi:hypothetical protein
MALEELMSILRKRGEKCMLQTKGSEMPYTSEQLLKMTAEQLDDLFRQSPPGDIPNGEAKGTAIIAPDTPFSPAIAEIINIFGWQGKTFDAASDTLVNQITFFGISAIEARIYMGPSLFDGNECIVLDYSENVTIARYVRDEIRLVGPQIYLGPVYWKGERTIYFALEFGQSTE